MLLTRLFNNELINSFSIILRLTLKIEIIFRRFARVNINKFAIKNFLIFLILNLILFFALMKILFVTKIKIFNFSIVIFFFFFYLHRVYIEY